MLTGRVEYILSYASTVGISDQPSGNPDTNGNQMGVYVNGRTYDTAILMMAIAASGIQTVK